MKFTITKEVVVSVALAFAVHAMQLYFVFDSYFPWFQTRRDGSLMTLAQSKKLSQMTADNAQWEDRQLLRSGAVKGTEVQTEFDDEEERKVILLVHGTFFAYQGFLVHICSLFEILDSVSFLITPRMLEIIPLFLMEGFSECEHFLRKSLCW